jgi:alkylation response protein AidB-like acyl-CoA dehydrogenase
MFANLIIKVEGALFHAHFLMIINKVSEFFSFLFSLVCVCCGQGMFVPAIKGQGTDEQQQKWLPLAYKMQIIGSYAQTELGHGSNVQGLETTATFDPETDEFVIHSPTLTSSKVNWSLRAYLISLRQINRLCMRLI